MSDCDITYSNIFLMAAIKTKSFNRDSSKTHISYLILQLLINSTLIINRHL